MIIRVFQEGLHPCLLICAARSAGTPPKQIFDIWGIELINSPSTCVDEKLVSSIVDLRSGGYTLY